MSLADELLADFEEDEIGQDEEEDEEMAEVTEVTAEVDYTSKDSVKHVAKLRDSKELTRIMKDIEQYKNQPRRTKVAGPVEADPEYRLIVEANNITVEIDNEINVIHKFTRDNYSKRFPELESLVPTPMEYVRTVKELSNNILENSKNNEALQEILTPATIMVVSVTASTTQGKGHDSFWSHDDTLALINLFAEESIKNELSGTHRNKIKSELSSEELSTVMEACQMAVDLAQYKSSIFDYVESRMSFIAPNLSIIVGASIAAKLMGIAGGLTNLSKMPACNILILGAQKKTLSGFSTAAVMPHTGHIFYSDIVQGTPSDLRKKAARLVAAKCVLAARVDSFHEQVDGSVGDNLRADIEQKLDKLQEPPPVKAVKALPAPIEQSKKKRGGRRARKMKERHGLTEMRKAANRMNFGEIGEDAYQDAVGFSLGNLGKSASGKIRGPVVDSKTKARISKTLQAKVQKQNNVWGGSTTVKRQISGTASSVAFTPLQGLEIVNPQAAEKKVAAANAKYFSSTAGFLKLNKEKT